MSIKFQCVECGCEIKVPDSAAGKRGKCPQCSVVNDVPKPIEVSGDDDFFDFILSEVKENRPPEDEAPIPFDDDEIGLNLDEVAPADEPEIAPPEPATPPPPTEPQPADVDDDDLLGLAPIDDEEERQREEQVRQLMEQERELMTDTDGGGGKRLEHREDIDASDLHHFIVNYCLDMVDGKLDQAKTHVDQLRKYRGLAGEAIDAFLSGKVEPVDQQAMERIPPPVLSGFLKSLKGELG